MTTTVRTIFSINATDRSHDFLVIRRGPAGISIEAQSREDEWESATAGPFTPEQLRAALDEVAPAGSYTRTDEPDDMDGGVTAALIEKEAEQRACPDLDAHWRLDEALETIERLTRERDEARGALRARLGVLAVPRPVEVTDAMIERARQRGSEIVGALWDASVVEAMLTAALTEPPARPEGAEEIEAYMREIVASHPEDHYGELADHLASRGVLPPVTDKTHPEEQQ